MRNSDLAAINSAALSVLSEENDNVQAVIKELIDTSWGGNNASQMKALQLLKGLATSDDPAANKFMQALDRFTSGLSADKF